MERSIAGDRRIVLTLDAGGTKFAFAAMRGGEEIVAQRVRPAHADDLERCLAGLLAGFDEVRRQLDAPPAAISFAFPGPADFPRGVIGDLWNLPAFRGGVALGPWLEERFGVPVFINNDGDLFAYGEAIGGFLPEVNRELARAGSGRRYRNLLGVTLGTGFGAGIVVDGRLLLGDNSCGAEIWLVRGLDGDEPCEEEISLRGVRAGYARLAGMETSEVPEPRRIAAIAEGRQPGDRAAARAAFAHLGEALGDALANAITLLDGLVVIGGGLAGAAPLFAPQLFAALNGRLTKRDGTRVPRLFVRVHDWDDPPDRARFLAPSAVEVAVPGGTRSVAYEPAKRVALGRSRLGTSRAVALGAYAFAVARLDGEIK